MADQGIRPLTIRVGLDCAYDWRGNRGNPPTKGRASAGWSAGNYSDRNDAGSAGTKMVTTQGKRKAADIVRMQGNCTARLTEQGR